jgi:hypothetical protein
LRVVHHDANLAASSSGRSRTGGVLVLPNPVETGKTLWFERHIGSLKGLAARHG